jgi:hypothetical protein
MKIAKQDWPSHVEALKNLDISTSVYARQHGLERSTLYRWQNKLKSARYIDADTNAEPLAAIQPPSKFVALRISEPVRVTPPASMHCTLVLVVTHSPKALPEGKVAAELALVC